MYLIFWYKWFFLFIVVILEKRAECSIEPKLETGCVWGCGVTTINESVTHESISGIKNSWNKLKNVFFLWLNFLHKISSLEKELTKKQKKLNSHKILFCLTTKNILKIWAWSYMSTKTLLKVVVLFHIKKYIKINVLFF